MRRWFRSYWYTGSHRVARGELSTRQIATATTQVLPLRSIEELLMAAANADQTFALGVAA